jgi:hypothetical protein
MVQHGISTAMQNRIGVDSPDYGPVLASTTTL